jgi:hypothetical protein
MSRCAREAPKLSVAGDRLLACHLYELDAAASVAAKAGDRPAA